MKLPIDQRPDGEVWTGPVATTVPAGGFAAFLARSAATLGTAVRRVAAGIGGRDDCDIPDQLREDAGLPPRAEPRPPGPTDRGPLW